MAVQKPSKPDVTLPDNFGGTKTPYTASQISNGYQEAVPQVVDGGNINYEKDGIFKYLKYLKTAIDALVDMPIGKVLTVDSSNRFEYVDKPEKPDYSSYQLISNLEQSLSQSTTKYPSSKAVNDGLAKKQATITGGASTIASNNLTASRALVSDGSGKVAVSAVTSTELGYLDGVTSNLQTQLNARAKTDLSNVSATGKSNVTNWTSPSTKWVDLTKPADNRFTWGEEQTAPADGYVTIWDIGRPSSRQVGIQNVTTGQIQLSGCYGIDTPCVSASMKVAKGNKFKLQRWRTDVVCRFYYLEGNK